MGELASLDDLLKYSNFINSITKNNANYKEYFFPKLFSISRDISPYIKLNKIFGEKESLDSLFLSCDYFYLAKPCDDNNIKNLPSLPEFKLKTEFIEGVIHLRRKVLERIPSKYFRSKHINGDQFIFITKLLLENFNKASIPSLDEIYISLCKKEDAKLINKSIKEYEKILREFMVSSNLKYYNPEKLKLIHKDAKETVINGYKNSMFNTNEESDFSKLKIAIKNKYFNFLKLTEEDTRSSVMKYLKLKFETFELKLKSSEISTLESLELSLSQVEKEYLLKFSESELTNQIFLDFKASITLYACGLIFKNFEIKIDVLQEEKRKLESKLKQELGCREVNEREKNNCLFISLREENSHLQLEIENLKTKHMHELQDKEERIQKSLDNNLEIRKEVEKEREDMFHKITSLEESKLSAERKLIQINAEFEKEKALLEQKLDYMNKLNDEQNKKEKNIGKDLKSQLKEQQAALKDASMVHEKAIKDHQIEIDKLREKIINLESELSSKENLLEMEKIKIEENEYKFKLERDNFQEKMSNLKRLFQEEKENILEEHKHSVQKANEYTESLLKEQEEFKNKYSKFDEEKSKKIDCLEREVMMLTQNNGFLEVKCTDLTSQINEQKFSLEKVINAFESKLNEINQNDSIPSVQNKIEELAGFYENEKKAIESSFKKEKENLKLELENLKDQYESLKIRNRELSEKLSFANLDLENSQKEVNKLMNEKNNIEDFFQSYKATQLEKIKTLNEEFERKLEQRELVYQEELKNINNNSQETLISFKSLFEMEKMRLEEKLKEQKIKNDSRNDITVQEYESKIKSVEMQAKEELEELQINFNELTNEYQNLHSNHEHEISILNSKIAKLELEIKEKEEQIKNMHSEQVQKAENNQNTIKILKDEFTTKIEAMNAVIISKDKEIISSHDKLKITEKKLTENQNNYNDRVKEYEEKYETLSIKFENYKTKQQETIDELLIKKLEFTRETALLKQQIEFLNTKLEEQANLHEETCREYEENLFSIKSDLVKDYNDKYEQVQKEKDDLAEKFDKKKKEMRDLEQTLLKQALILEKEKNSLFAEVSKQQSKKKEIIESYQIEFEKVSLEMSNMRAEFSKEVEGYKTLNEDLKKKYKEILTMKNELQKDHDNEKKLGQNKIKFLETQKEQLHRELIETGNKAEKVIETLQKKAEFEKNEIESLYKDKLIEIEKKWQTQLRETQESHDNIYAEMVTHNQELERELKNLSLQVSLRNKSHSDPVLISKKVSDLIEVQEKLKSQLEDSKIEHEQKINDIIMVSEKEKNQLKIKIKEIEQKFKEFESKKGIVLIEYEKEKVRWNLEKEHLISNNEELQETASRLQKKVESLLRENEKIRIEKDKETLHRRINSNNVSNIVNGMTSNFVFNEKVVTVDKGKGLSSNMNSFNFSASGNATPKCFSPKKKSIINKSNDILSAEITDKFENIFNKQYKLKYEN